MLVPTALVAALLTSSSLPAPPPTLRAAPQGAPRTEGGFAASIDLAARRAAEALVARHGQPARARAERGVAQAAAFWRPADGDAQAFEAFALQQFAADPTALDAVFRRLETALEALDGHQLEIQRELSRWAQLDLGPMVPVDGLLAAHDPFAHTVDDLFDGKVAFVALLNFPLTTLEERLSRGEGWSRREWAEVRLANRFARRVPARVSQRIARASAAADQYVADYNLWVHHLLSAEGARLFPRGKRLLSHWNLRDELRAQYAEPDGLPRQRAIARAMERIVTQTIPAAVVNDPTVDWNPFTNEVRAAPPEAIEAGRRPRARVDPARERDVRYARILDNFRAVRAADPYSPSAPDFVARKFELEREIPETRVVALLEEVLGSP